MASLNAEPSRGTGPRQTIASSPHRQKAAMLGRKDPKTRVAQPAPQNR